MRIPCAAGIFGAILVVTRFVSPALAEGGFQRGECYALLIGVRQYEPSELRSLKFTEADVEELAEVLQKTGYPKENIRVMTQTRGAERTRLLPTAANIRTELELMLGNLDDVDRVVVAMAGHGVQLTGGEESYFCPADARLSDTATLIPLSQVYAALERCGAGSKVLLVDACRNDPLTAQARDAGRPVVDTPSLTRPLKKRPPGGVGALFSCSGGELAFENPDLKHGVFFHFVIKALAGAADFDNDATIDFDELSTYTKRRVYRFVESEYRVKQTPELLGRGNLVELVRLPRGEAVVPSAKDQLPKQEELMPSLAARETSSSTTPNLVRSPITMTTTIGLKLVQIPAGEFLMGSPDSDPDAKEDEKPQHRVRISRPFYLGATEVTQGQFSAVIPRDPRIFGAGYDDYPMSYVTWNEAIEFCNKLSEREGLKPYYQFGAGAKSGGDGYRLPTEAEWEYACRAGNPKRYGFGDSVASLEEYAWFDGNSGAKSHPVGLKSPNAFGLYDMHGNVKEWCWDVYDRQFYRESPGVDPSGPSSAGRRVNRGGRWDDDSTPLRSAARDWLPADSKFDRLGFRIARSQPER